MTILAIDKPNTCLALGNARMVPPVVGCRWRSTGRCRRRAARRRCLTSCSLCLSRRALELLRVKKPFNGNFRAVCCMHAAKWRCRARSSLCLLRSHAVVKLHWLTSAGGTFNLTGHGCLWHRIGDRFLRSNKSSVPPTPCEGSVAARTHGSSSTSLQTGHNICRCTARRSTL